MVEDRIGYRYAKSVYSLADERKETEAVRDDMQLNGVKPNRLANQIKKKRVNK